jgi:hypothetical protein
MASNITGSMKGPRLTNIALPCPRTSGFWRLTRKGTTGCNLRETGSKLARPMGVVGAVVMVEVAAEAVAEAVEAVVVDHPITEV